MNAKPVPSAMLLIAILATSGAQADGSCLVGTWQSAEESYVATPAMKTALGLELSAAGGLTMEFGASNVARLTYANYIVERIMRRSAGRKVITEINFTGDAQGYFSVAGEGDTLSIKGLNDVRVSARVSTPDQSWSIADETEERPPHRQDRYTFECSDDELILTKAEHGQFGADYRGRFVRTNSLINEHPQVRPAGELSEDRSPGLAAQLAAEKEAEVELALNPAAPPEPVGPRASIVGQMVDADSHQPIAAMEVTIVPAGKESLQVFMGRFQTLTDADGRFTIADLPVGKALLVARKANPIYHHTDENFQVSVSAQSRRVEAQQLQVKKISIPMVVVGYVRNRETGLPIERAKVSGGNYHSVNTDDEGKFLLELETGQEWQVQASHKEYRNSATQLFSSPRPRKFETEYLLDRLPLARD